MLVSPKNWPISILIDSLPGKRMGDWENTAALLRGLLNWHRCTSTWILPTSWGTTLFFFFCHVKDTLLNCFLWLYFSDQLERECLLCFGCKCPWLVYKYLFVQVGKDPHLGMNLGCTVVVQAEVFLEDKGLGLTQRGLQTSGFLQGNGLVYLGRQWMCPTEKSRRGKS